MSTSRVRARRAMALHAAAVLAAIAGGIAGYHLLVVKPAIAVGVVDISEVYRAKEAEFTQLLTRSGDEEGRQRALAMARGFSRRLPVAIEELSAECGCLLLVRSAVASAPRGRDLTPLLRRKLETP